MKICIIAHTEKNYLPYMDKYINFFGQAGVEYDIICWDRETKSELHPDNEYHFYYNVESGIFSKISAYIKYRHFVLKLLKKKHYDKIVVLTTVPAIFLYGYLTRKYENRYLFDFRDYSFERFKPYKKKVDRLIDKSALTTISSHGFMDFLAPNKKIVINHNLPIDFPTGNAGNLKEKQVINIGFLGGVRYYDENTALIDSLKNTFRYQLWYIGKPVPNCNLQEFCEDNEITNVSFVGKFDNSQKAELYKNIDIINSIYGNSSLEVTTALPNRLYEACLLQKPIISSKGTFLGELIDRYDLGLVVDVDADDVLTMVNEYVDNFLPEDFAKGCEEFLADVSKDENALIRCLRAFIKPSSDERKKHSKKAKAAVTEEITEAPQDSPIDKSLAEGFEESKIVAPPIDKE